MSVAERAIKILMVGMHEGYANLFRHDPELALYVLEEETIYRREATAYASYPAVDVLLTPYQQSNDAVEAATAWHNKVGFDAVVPAWEYGVATAGALAQAWGLRSAGRRAIDACTDKLTLRRLLAESGIHQPRWLEVTQAADVAAFLRDEAVVLKPSNRHASVGVVRVDDPVTVNAAWQECISAEESRTTADRPRITRFIVEEFVPGYQISIETLVRDREVIFNSVDLMLTAGGPYFPILSVTVPAPIADADRVAAIRAAYRLVAALDVHDGMIHSEWKITDGVPYLIEAAARVPGAFTPELADRAYGGFDMYGAQVRTLAGLDARLPGPLKAVAAVRWFHPPSGTLTAIEGTDVLTDNPAIFRHRIKVAPGDEIPVCRDGWQRIGYFAAHASAVPELERTIAEVLDTVVFTVQPAPPASGQPNPLP